MAGGRRKLRSIPVNYRAVRLPRETVIRRFAEGDQLRRNWHRDGGGDGGGASVYEQRGIVEV